MMRSFSILTSPHLFSPLYIFKETIFQTASSPNEVQTYQFSYCSLVIASRFLGHHLGYLIRQDPGTVEKSDRGLTRGGDGCVLRATELITHIWAE